MNYYIILRPLIGAGIGYVTNWIAVKMLFKPINPIKIGHVTLPFTPGIIPKNKKRIAISIGDSISTNLLSEETLKETLLSDEKLEELEKIINIKIDEYLNVNTKIEEIINSSFQEEQLNKMENTIINKLSSSIYNSVKEANLADTISEQILVVAKEKLKGSLLGIFGGNAIISSLKPELNSQINMYIENNGKELICSMVINELNKIKGMKVNDLVCSAKENNINISSIILELYKKIVINHLSSLLNSINISKIVSDKIISMPTEELEKLLLEIMKKELNALVNLGAVIGFILGLLNLLF